MLYHWAVFGGPFEFGYYHLTEPAFQEIYSDSQTFGLQTPKLDVAWKILFSWHGLIPYAPAIVLVPWGLMNLWRNGQRSVVAFIALAFGSLWLINASHPTWTGGWTTGPRYVQAGVPFLYLAVAMSQKQAGVWGKGILYGGTVLGFVICLGSVSWEWGGHLPDLGYAGGENPISQVIYPQLRKGIMLNWSLGNWMIYGEWSHPQRGNYEAYLLLLGFVGVMVSLLFRLTSSPQLAFPSGWEMASVFTGVREQLPEFSVHEVVGTETHRDQNIGTGVQEATIPEASSKAL